MYNEDKGRPILTNYKGSCRWTFRDENGLLSEQKHCYEEIKPNSGTYKCVLTKEDQIKTRKKIMKEYGLTEEQVNDLDLEAYLFLKKVFSRSDLADKYVLAFKYENYDKGFDMYYNKKDTKRKEHFKISKEDSKERDRIATRHKKLGIAKIIEKSRMKRIISGIILAATFIMGGIIHNSNALKVGESVPRIETSMKDREMGVLEGVKDTEKHLKQLQLNKDDKISENKFVRTPFLQEYNIEFDEFIKRNQEQNKKETENQSNRIKDKEDKSSEKENKETDKTNRKISLEGKEHYGVDKLALNEIILDMMKPYCKAKVGGKIYVDPTDALREKIGQKTQGKIQTKSETLKDLVYAKGKVKYQSPDGKYICFNLEDYEKDIKEGNIRKVIIDVKKALEEKGLDSNYILSQETQKVYLLEAKGISQWMKAEDTTIYEFEIDQFGNRIEKKADEKASDKRVKDEKVKNNSQNEAKKNEDENISDNKNNKLQYERVDFKKVENAQVVLGSAITVTVNKDEISDVIKDYKEDIEDAQEKYSEERNLEAYQKAVKEAQERHDLMMEAIQEQMEIEEEEER